jgi:glutamate/tyrosine decarboxylase-like PLP-dependent enzyme
LELNRVAAKHSTRYGAVYRRAWTQNRENNPMQSRMGPRLAALELRCVRGTLQLFVLHASDASVFI